MKITFTADDGRHFDNEAECLGYERIRKLIQLAMNDYSDPNFDRDFSEFLQGEHWQGHWENRHHFYRLAELMKQAEMG